MSRHTLAPTSIAPKAESLECCGGPGGLLDLRTVGRAGFLVDLLLVFGTQPGPAVEALAQDVLGGVRILPLVGF
ncbi:hypothetical protein [Streptomyces sp. XY431]|uniref:hypothetical protein n=1 Tax=Streptomyces sp. XY431 TaxID=1415562 RepID=UPI0013317125|nr:hypothetical protein [Streptomyces sp. XY431]